MSVRPSVAVVVPCRDAPTISQCVQALVEATRDSDPLVVVDDGSRAAVNEVGERVRCVRQEHGGPARARNRGARETASDVLVFVDADVVVPRDSVERLLGHLRPGVVAVQAVYAAGGAGFAARLSNAMQRFQMLRIAPGPLAGLSSYCVAIRREAFETAGGFDERLARPTIEDDNLGLRLARLGRVVVAADVAVEHLATPSVAELVRRRYRMAHDRGLTVDAWLANRPPPETRTHHPRATLVSAAMAGAALLCPPAAPPLVVASALAEWELLGWLAREEGTAVAIGAAGLLPALAGAGAVGAAVGLARRLLPLAPPPA